MQFLSLKLLLKTNIVLEMSFFFLLENLYTCFMIKKIEKFSFLISLRISTQPLLGLRTASNIKLNKFKVIPFQLNSHLMSFSWVDLMLDGLWLVNIYCKARGMHMSWSPDLINTILHWGRRLGRQGGGEEADQGWTASEKRKQPHSVILMNDAI